MRAKTIAIFGISYAVILGAAVVTSIIVMRLIGWDASFQKIVKQTGFALNMIAFALAIGIALSRRVHDRLGGAPGPIAFRQFLAQSRPVIAVSFAILAMLIDVCALKLASWYFAGEMAAPSLLRLVVLVGAYCVIAWMLMSDFKTKRRVLSDIEFPRRQAEAILKKTMKEVGYRRTYTEIGLWSAFWLEERFQRGVMKLVIYLCLVNGRDTAELRPRKHPQFGIAGVCPFMLAEAVIHLSDKWGPGGGVSFGAPAEPFLMMASVADLASAKGQSVRFHHRTYSCLMSNEGVDIETDDLSAVGWIDPDNESPMTIELTDDRPSPGACRIETVKLPKARLRGRNALNLN